MAAEAVQGYTFRTHPDDDNPLYEREGDICKIVGRALDVSDTEVMEFGPAFVVKFGDGALVVVHAEELRPWYPT